MAWMPANVPGNGAGGGSVSPGLGPAWLWGYAIGTSFNIAKGLFGPQSPVMYPRVSKPGAYPTFQRIGTSEPIAPYFVQNYMNARKWTLDNDAGDVTGTADYNITGPPHIADCILRKWGNGVTGSDMVTAASQFGSFREVRDELQRWTIDNISTDLGWYNNVTISQLTSIKAAIAALCAQAPFFVSRRNDGLIYAGVYPVAQANADHFWYNDSAGNRVKIHPNSQHPGAADFGKPYAVEGFTAALTPSDEIFNRFTVNYRQFMPTGKLESRQYVCEADASCILWEGSSTEESLPVGSATDLAGELGYNVATICAASQARYGLREMPEINLDFVYGHVVATAFLNYLVRRYTNPRIVFSCQGGIEFSDLCPGHIIRISNDMNYEATRPDYINQPAKLAGWNTTGATGVADYLVNSVRLLPASGSFSVEFSAEQIIYTPV
ncbi:MAG: hypothetical protein WC683_09900 [bacterium]